MEIRLTANYNMNVSGYQTYRTDRVQNAGVRQRPSGGKVILIQTDMAYRQLRTYTTAE